MPAAPAASSAAPSLSLPADASNIRLRLGDSSQMLFRSALDDLLEYPYGCVEQTASRLLPLSLAYPALVKEEVAKGEARIGEREVPLYLAQLRAAAAEIQAALGECGHPR